MRSSQRSLAIAIVIAVTAGPASANGRFPSVISGHWQQGGGNQLIIGATFGGVFSKDGGQSFHWICEQAIGYGGFFDPEFALNSNGVLFASTFDGLARSEDGGCSWGYAYGDILGYWVDGYALHPTDPNVVVASTSSGGKMNGIMKSTDGGKSFTIVPGTLSATQFWKSLKFAPSDGSRIYATSYIATPASNTFWISRDGGASFTPSDFPMGGGAEFKLLAVAPNDPDIVFARTVMAGTGEQPYTIYRSSDAGAHWTQVFQTTDLLTTLSVSNDGQSVVMAATASVYKSTDGGLNFMKVANAPQLVCTTLHGNNLDGCGNNFADGFAFGESTGFGANWTKIFKINELKGVVDCSPTAKATWLPTPDSTDMLMMSRNAATACGPLWPMTATQLGVTGADDGGVVPDGAVPLGTGHSTTMVMGTAGGTMLVDNLSLTIPSGALATDQQITITSTMDPLPKGYVGFSPVYRFEPAGLSFAKPVTVSIPFVGDSHKAGIFWSSATGTGYDRLDTSNDGSFAMASTTHFSTAFVGYKSGSGTSCGCRAAGRAPGSSGWPLLVLVGLGVLVRSTRSGRSGARKTRTDSVDRGT